MTKLTHGEGGGSQADTARAVYDAYYANGAPKNARVYPKGELKGPCPYCGGDDRFWTRPDGFVCRQCEPGGNTVTRKAVFLAILEALGIDNGESTQPAFKPRHTAPKRKGAPVPAIDGVRPKAVKVTGKVAPPRKQRGRAKRTDVSPIVYEYPDESGHVLWRVKRWPTKWLDGTPDKEFTQKKRALGHWVPGKPEKYKGHGKAPLYQLPILRQVRQDQPEAEIRIVEGEKCTDAISRHGAGFAVTWAGGAATWRNADWEPLRGASVLLISDADDPVRTAMREIAAHLYNLECGVRIALMPGKQGRILPTGWTAAALRERRSVSGRTSRPTIPLPPTARAATGRW